MKYILFILGLFVSEVYAQDNSLITQSNSYKEGYALYSNGSYLHAIHFCDSILNSGESSGLDQYVGNEILARCHYKLGDLRGAYRYKFKVLELGKGLPEAKSELLDRHLDLAAIQMELGAGTEAIGTLNESLHISKELKTQSQQLAILNKLGDAYRADGDTLKAKESYTEGLYNFRKWQGKDSEDSITGQLILAKINYINALECNCQRGLDTLQEVISYMYSKNQMDLAAQLHFFMGERLLYSNSGQEGIKHLIRAESIAKSIGLHELNYQILLLQTMYYSSIKEFDEAHLAIKRLKKIQNYLSKSGQRQNLLTETAGLKLDKLRKEIEIKRLNSEKESLASTIYLYKIIALIIILLIGARYILKRINL